MKCASRDCGFKIVCTEKDESLIVHTLCSDCIFKITNSGFKKPHPWLSLGYSATVKKTMWTELGSLLSL